VLGQFKIKITKTEFMMAVPFISPLGLTITPALSAFEWRVIIRKLEEQRDSPKKKYDQEIRQF